MTVTRLRLPVRIVVLATTVVTAAVLATVAAVLDHRGLAASSGAREGQSLTTWLNPERAVDLGHPSGPSPRLAGPSRAHAGAG
jgi:hypothetical protein